MAQRRKAEMDIHELLEMMVERSASDLHLSVGSPPVLRIDGGLRATEFPGLTPADTERLTYAILTEEQIDRFQRDSELDFSFGVPKLSRFRVNVHRQRGSIATAIRSLAREIPTVEELGLPPIVGDLASRPRGLVLVTGPSGCGKSTTLAAMIGLINSTCSCHVITIEDPIEYLHRNDKSVIEQREIGGDTKSFPVALRHILRQDPDVILIGEMRDLETMSAAITSAETGHLVLATLHTIDAPQVVDRIVDAFPPYQQPQVRMQLSVSLAGVIAQQLVNRADGKGRIPVVEVLLSTSAIRNLIREGKTHQIYSDLETGARFGMQSLNQALAGLCREGVIKVEDALAIARDPEALRKKISGGK